MKPVPQGQFDEIQRKELEWWTNYNFNPAPEWVWYDKYFADFLQGDLGHVIDVGSGPVPYLCNPTLDLCVFDSYAAVDPLILEYARIEKYKKWTDNIDFIRVTDVGQVAYESIDTVFFLNTLDHAQEPMRLLHRVWSTMKFGGRIFLLVDIDKQPDAMHPHTLPRKLVENKLASLFETELFLLRKSWKFQSKTLWFVGAKA